MTASAGASDAAAGDELPGTHPPATDVPSPTGLVTAIYLPSLLFGIGQGAIVPVVALSALDLGASVAVAAFAVAAVGIGKIAGDVPAGILAARLGERRAMLVATAVVVVALLACALARSVPVLCCGLVAVGAASAVWGLARQTYLTEVVPFAYRGRALSTLGGMQRVGMFVGPMLAAVAMGPLGIAGAYWLHVVAAVLAAVLLLVLPEPDPGERAGRPTTVPHDPLVAVVRRNLPVFATLGLGSLLISAARAARQVIVPLWAVQIGLDPVTASVLYGLSGAVEMLVFYPGGIAMDRFGRRPVVVAAMLGLASALVAVPLTAGATSLGLVAGFMGMANGVGSGINMTIGSDASPAIGRSTFLGAWRLCTDVGNGIGPVAVSVISGFTALAPAVLFMGAVAGAAALLLGRWLPRRAG